MTLWLTRVLLGYSLVFVMLLTGLVWFANGTDFDLWPHPTDSLQD